MAEWRVLIADDEPAARRGVRQQLAAFPAFTVVRECRNGQEVLAALDEASPHVVFLDVQMPGLDGFEVIRRRTPERMPAVIFLTAYDEFALKAFEAEAVDYLVKPVTEARFAATIKRLLRRLDVNPSSAEPGLVVTGHRTTKVIRVGEIDWIESADNYCRLWVGRRSYLLRESLDALESRIGMHGFARAHRQALVRLDAVRELLRLADDRTVAVLQEGVRVPVSRRRRPRFMAAINARAR